MGGYGLGGFRGSSPFLSEFDIVFRGCAVYVVCFDMDIIEIKYVSCECV